MYFLVRWGLYLFTGCNALYLGWSASRHQLSGTKWVCCVFCRLGITLLLYLPELQQHYLHLLSITRPAWQPQRANDIFRLSMTQAHFFTESPMTCTNQTQSCIMSRIKLIYLSTIFEGFVCCNTQPPKHPHLSSLRLYCFQIYEFLEANLPSYTNT